MDIINVFIIGFIYIEKSDTVHSKMVNKEMTDLARVRQYDIKELSKYNLLSSYLFETNGFMTTTQKSSLVTELVIYLDDKDDTNLISSPMRTVYFVDVLSCLRKMDLEKYLTFSELCQAFLMYVVRLFRDANEIHYAFDTYMERSVKDSERSKRYQNISTDINMMTNDTLYYQLTSHPGCQIRIM